MKCSNIFRIVLVLLLCFELRLIAANLCNICTCTTEEVKNKSSFIINCRDNDAKKIDYDFIDWPVQSIQIHAIFNNLDNFDVLPRFRISHHTKVVSLNLDSNPIRLIRLKPFSNMKELRNLSFANILTTNFADNFLHDIPDLEILNLSNTSISDDSLKMLSSLSKLKEINLSHNRFKYILPHLLTSIKTLEIINFCYNSIESIDPPDENEPFKLRELILSHNKIVHISNEANILKFLTNLETLDLSHNQIVSVDSNAFVQLTQLNKLDLSFNEIVKINNLNFTTRTLKFLILANNQITELSLVTTNNIQEFYLQNNSLTEVPAGTYEKLTILNISKNYINEIPSSDFLNMKILDLSENKFTSLPPKMEIRAPTLESLILDSNPLKAIIFFDEIRLKSLSLNHMPFLESIDQNSFYNILPAKDRSGNYGGVCIDLSISHCSTLKTIHEDALRTFELCKLDLSYNQFQTIPQSLVNWGNIEDGINLQGNPFICDCTSDWMINNILNPLYKNVDHQKYLHELKCAGPEPFTDQRFVKYYGRANPFCITSEKMIAPEMVASAKIIDGTGGGISLDFSRGPNYITIIISSIVILAALIIFGIYWTKQQNKVLERHTKQQNKVLERNRRFK